MKNEYIELLQSFLEKNQKAEGKDTSWGNMIQDEFIFYVPKGYTCHLTIDKARVKKATRDERKIAEIGGYLKSVIYPIWRIVWKNLTDS